MPRLGRTIPALPVSDVAAAVSDYGERFGFEPLHRDEDVDALYEELRGKDLLHPGVPHLRDTDFGSREFATVDRDGKLIEFFRWR